MKEPIEGTKDSLMSADDGFDISENQKLMSRFIEELERLNGSENARKDPVFEKAAKLGIDLIKGNE